MPEDTRLGFLRFQDDNFRFRIADENAWNAPGLLTGFSNGFPGNPAYDDPGNALEAVQTAALRKFLRTQDPQDDLPSDNPNDVGDGFLFEPFDLI